MNKLEDSPAFPVSDSAVLALGLTKREHFAGIALQGLLAMGPDAYDADYGTAARVAVGHADALLAELAKTTSQSC